VPDADPCDGGTDARLLLLLLLLLERPAAALRRPGFVSGCFVSRDNATPTARNIRRFTEAAGLPRAEMLIWNALPWMDDGVPMRNRAPRPDEIRAGLLWLPPLLALLPRLEVVVLAGRAARMAEGMLRARPHLLVLAMPHPSPTIVCTSPLVRDAIMAALNQATRTLTRAS
jgi:uracil-DNA glycosylase